MRGTTWAIALSLVAGCAVDADDATGTTEQAIIGGATAHTVAYPTVVGIEDNQGWFCSGVLIDKDWVLSVANCFNNYGNGTNFRIRFDSDNLTTQSGHTVNVTAIHFHPAYAAGGWAHDLSLIKLATSVTDRAPTPIARAAVAVGTQVTQLGYGATDNNGSGIGTLRKGTAATTDCGVTANSTVSTTGNLCFPASIFMAGCGGDEGGPGFITVGGALQVAGVGAGGTSQNCTLGFDIFTAAPGELAFIDTYVPVVGAVPPPMNPDPGGGGTPTQPTPPTDPTNPSSPGYAGSNVAGCNAGGSGGSGALVLLALALVVSVRRARSRRA